MSPQETELLEKFEKLKAFVEAADADMQKFVYRKVDAAATRVRKNLSNIGILCKELRKETQEARGK